MGGWCRKYLSRMMRGITCIAQINGWAEGKRRENIKAKIFVE